MVSQLKVNEIIKQSGSSISIGESGDTINLAGSAYAAAGTNTPYVMAGLTSTATISDNTWTTVVFDNELYDTGSIYNNSTGVCTPTAGTYHIFAYIGLGNSADDAISDHGIRFYLNGSTQLAENTNYNVDVQRLTVSSQAIYTFSGSDTFVVQGYSNVTSGTPNFDGVAANRWGTYFGMYKIIT